jgi:hypothetical protein
MQRKALAAVEFKQGGPEGAFKARIATLNVVDKEGDVTLPGAFPVGKEVIVSAYMHTSWGGALPVGKGVIAADDEAAWIDGQFFTDTTNGLDTYKTVKALGKAQEWSYGYDVLDSSVNAKDLEAYVGAKRILKSMDVFEASPVLVGAGVNTATESIKSAHRARAFAERIKAVDDPDPATLAAIAQIDLLADQLDELVDTLMDQFGIPDEDEVAEGEPEEAGKNFSFSDHAKNALAGVTAFVSRTQSLADLRAKKQKKEGRVLSAGNRERLAVLADGLTSALTDIQDLLTSTDPADPGKAAGVDEEIHSIWLAHQQRQTDSVGSA